MPRHDYSGDEDYYTQNFECEGMVSIWLELARPKDDQELDALQDCCGVGYYDIDLQESDHYGEVVRLDRLFSRISYSDSFSASAIERAKAMEIESAYWVLVQFDFCYDPSMVKRTPTDDLVFLGAFRYQRQ